MISALFDLTRELQNLNVELKIFKCLPIELDIRKTIAYMQTCIKILISRNTSCISLIGT